MRFVLYWLGFSGLALAISWIYQPTLNLVIVSTVVLIGLAGVVAWSALRLSHGQKAFLKVMLVAVVAGFMHTQAMDIAYSASFAPAGGRLPVLVETLMLGVLLTATSVLFARLSLGSQKDKQSEGN